MEYWSDGVMEYWKEEYRRQETAFRRTTEKPT
jgi:hypothetical protein